jgi:hypothetical protein
MTRSDHTERREWERTQIEVPVTLVTAPGGKNSYHDAITVDLTSHGARVRSHLRLTPGEPVELITSDSVPNMPYIVPTQVVWMSKSLGEAGLRFLGQARPKTTPQAQHSVMA